MGPLPSDYRVRTYAGLLGKIIGVYLGRPVEQWTHDRIQREMGEIRGYVSHRRSKPLVVADDDISGTIAFLRAVREHGFDPGLTSEQIGDTWLNQLIEGKGVLWWGGFGISTEHTAYLRLLNGVKAPRSGSMELNGPTISEQIGGQIFIDGWGMLCPGDPELAADFARRAASVSHDGEAVHAAAALASMVAAAYAEPQPLRLLDAAQGALPPSSLLKAVYDDVREWSSRDQDWRTTLKRIQSKWGYEAYGGGCHVLPNHALIVLALANGGDSFDEALCIVNTAGYDTDCNSGNVGCILGVAGGLEAIDRNTDWRSPIADRLLVAAVGGDVVTDAAREADRIVSYASKMRGEGWSPPIERFHFELPGSQHGFMVHEGAASLSNPGGFLNVEARSDFWLRTAVHTWPEVREAKGYACPSSPTLFPGQIITAAIEGPPGRTCRLRLTATTGSESHASFECPPFVIAPGRNLIEWMPDLPLEAMIEFLGLTGEPGCWKLHFLTWSGEPDCLLAPGGPDQLLKEQWISAASQFSKWSHNLSVAENHGMGLVLSGSYEWRDITIETKVHSHLSQSHGLAVRVQGLRRFIAAARHSDHRLRITEHYDGRQTVLAEAEDPYALCEPAKMRVILHKSDLAFYVGDIQLDAKIREELCQGMIALLVEQGAATYDSVRIRPTLR